MYLNNKELYKEILVCKAKGKLTPEAQKMFLLLAKNINRKFYYQDSEDRLDCLQGGILDMLRFWYNFDEMKSQNAFAYYTEICKRGHAKTWNEIYKYKEHNIISLTNDENGGYYNI